MSNNYLELLRKVKPVILEADDLESTDDVDTATDDTATDDTATDDTATDDTSDDTGDDTGDGTGDDTGDDSSDDSSDDTDDDTISELDNTQITFDKKRTITIITALRDLSTNITSIANKLKLVDTRDNPELAQMLQDHITLRTELTKYISAIADIEDYVGMYIEYEKFKIGFDALHFEIFPLMVKE